MKFTLPVSVLGAALFVTGNANAAICDLEVESALGSPVYTVTVDGQAYKGKRYATYDDALQLRDVLVQIGECSRQSVLRKCDVQRASNGEFYVMRGGTNFNDRMSYRSEAQARRQAETLASKHLCTTR